MSSLSRPLNEETLGLLHVKRLVEVVLQVHLSLEETLGLLHMIRLVEVVLQAHLSLEETLGLLHVKRLVEVVLLAHLSLEETLGLLPHDDDDVEVSLRVLPGRQVPHGLGSPGGG